LARAGFTLAALGVLLAIGEHGYLYSLQQYAPLANRFRFPCRAIVIADLGLALLTAVAWSELLRKSRFESFEAPKVRGALQFCCGLAIALAILGPLAWPDFTAVYWKVWAGPALFLAAALVVNSVARRRRWAFYALPALLAADLAIYGLSAGAYRNTAELESFRAATLRPPLDAQAGARVVCGGGKCSQRVGDRLLLTGLARADGYAGLEPLRRLDYQAENVQRAAGVRYRSVSPQDAAETTVDADFADAESGAIWAPVKNPLPRARLVTRVAKGEPQPDLSGLDLDRWAITAETLTLRKATPGQATIISDHPGAIDVKTVAATPQLLVLSEAFDRGWQVEVDGQIAPVLRVNGDFLGCLAPAGKHDLCWRFRPASVVSGRRTSLLGIGLLIAWLFDAWLSGRLEGKRPTSGSPVPSRRATPDFPPIPTDFSPSKTQPGSPDPVPATLCENPYVRIPNL
jgi:hypothetical protein